MSSSSPSTSVKWFDGVIAMTWSTWAAQGTTLGVADEVDLRRAGPGQYLVHERRDGVGTRDHVIRTVEARDAGRVAVVEGEYAVAGRLQDRREPVPVVEHVLQRAVHKDDRERMRRAGPAVPVGAERARVGRDQGRRQRGRER
jgi:hypothetical protein